MGYFPGVYNLRINSALALGLFGTALFILREVLSGGWIGAPGNVIVADQMEFKTWHPHRLTHAFIQTCAQTTMSDNLWIPLESNPEVSSCAAWKVSILLISDV